MKRIFIFVSALIVSSLIGGVVFATLPQPTSASQSAQKMPINALYVYKQALSLPGAPAAPKTPVANEMVVLAFQANPYNQLPIPMVAVKTNSQGLIYWTDIQSLFNDTIYEKNLISAKMSDNLKIGAV